MVDEHFAIKGVYRDEKKLYLKKPLIIRLLKIE